MEELASELDRVAEGLADAAMEVLREALASVRRGLDEVEPGRGDQVAESAKQQEKVLNRARSSVEKAARLLRGRTFE
ncbi:MAG: hypothetical protein ACRDZT_06615 [Acidimicrobiales bacterium]